MMDESTDVFRIYRLRDPRNGAIRYVGITHCGLQSRLGGHVRNARYGANTYSARWIRVLLRESLKPEIELIEETADATRENYWIARYREEGHYLTNLSTGGEVAVNRIFTAEHRAHLSASVKGRRYSPEVRAAMSSRRKGKHPSVETRQRLSDALKGRSWSESRRRAGSPVRRLLTFNGETRPLDDWAAVTGIKTSTIRQRIDAYGWDVERALTTRGDGRSLRHRDGKPDTWTNRHPVNESGVYQ